MAWQSKDGAEHESDVTRKPTVYNDSCNSNNEVDLDNSLEKDVSSLVDEFKGLDEETIMEIILQRCLQSYDEEKIQEFLNEEIDEDIPPLVFSAKAQRDMIDALATSIGEEEATQIIEKQARKLEWERAQWKRERRHKFYSKLMKKVSVAVAVIVVVVGVGLLGDTAGAWSLPKISFSSIDRDNYSDVILESGSDIVRTEIEEVYELGMVLDGYKLVDSEMTPKMNYFAYENEVGELYTFRQQVESLAISINTEYKSEEVVDTLYGDSVWGYYDNINYLIWNYRGFAFLIEGNVSKEQLLELQNYLKIKE